MEFSEKTTKRPVAVRIGFDDNRTLGPRETGGTLALPVFRELVMRAYGEKLLGPAPQFPAEMERRIDAYLAGSAPGQAVTAASMVAPAGQPGDPGLALETRFNIGAFARLP